MGRAEARDIRLFNPDVVPGATFGVSHSGLLPEGLTPFFGLWLDFADAELVAIEVTRRAGVITDSARAAIIDSRLAMSVGAGLALFSRASISVLAPVYLTRADGRDAAISAGDIHLQGRVHLLGESDRGFGLGVATALSLPTGPTSRWSGAGAVSGSFGVTGHWLSRGGHGLSASLMWRLRPSMVVLDRTLTNDLRWGLAGQAQLVAGLRLLGEIEGLLAPSTLNAGASWDMSVPIEARIGVAVALGEGFDLRAFSATGLTGDLGAPDYRLGLGLLWQPSRAPDAAEPAARSPLSPHPPTGPGPEGSPLGGHETHKRAAPAASDTPPIIKAEAFAAAIAADPDPDGDGLLSEAVCRTMPEGCPARVDACPDEPEDFDGFEDEDGCPDPDNDGDGIPDSRDRCPNEPETFNNFEDDDGCPDTLEGADEDEGVVEVDDQLTVGEIGFRSGSDQLVGDAQGRLDKLAQFLKSRPRIKRLFIEGHTDDQGDKEFNVDLSERRAGTVRRYLITQGVETERLTARGFGATRPIATNGTPAGRAQNRRVVFQIGRDFKARPTTSTEEDR